MSLHVNPAPYQRNNNNDDDTDSATNWQPIGAAVRKLIRKLNMPLPTALVVLEQAGIRTEAE